MVLTDELCDWLSATAREKSRGLEIDISFAVCNEHSLSQMYRQYSRALVLSVTLEAGGRPLLLLEILKREGRGFGRRRGLDAPGRQRPVSHRRFVLENPETVRHFRRFHG